MQTEDAAQLIAATAELMSPPTDVIDLEQPGLWGLQVSDVDVVVSFQQNTEVFTLQTFDEFPQGADQAAVYRMLLQRNIHQQGAASFRTAIDPTDHDIVSETDIEASGLDCTVFGNHVSDFAAAVRNLRQEVRFNES